MIRRKQNEKKNKQKSDAYINIIDTEHIFQLIKVWAIKIQWPYKIIFVTIFFFSCFKRLQEDQYRFLQITIKIFMHQKYCSIFLNWGKGSNMYAWTRETNFFSFRNLVCVFEWTDMYGTYEGLRIKSVICQKIEKFFFIDPGIEFTVHNRSRSVFYRWLFYIHFTLQVTLFISLIR